MRTLWRMHTRTAWTGFGAMGLVSLSPASAAALTSDLELSDPATLPVLATDSGYEVGILTVTAQVERRLFAPQRQAVLVAQAHCDGDDSDTSPELHSSQVRLPLSRVPLGEVWPSLQEDPSTLPPFPVALEIPWDGGFSVLDPDTFGSARAYLCVLEVQVQAQRPTETVRASLEGVSWSVQVAQQAETLDVAPGGTASATAEFYVDAVEEGAEGELIPVSVIASDGTEQTVGEEGNPVQSDSVQVGIDVPASYPVGSRLPLFGGPVLKFLPEGSVFSRPVLMALPKQGLLKDEPDLELITYDEEAGRWRTCSELFEEDGSCEPVECPPAVGEGMVCGRVRHFSFWSLGNDLYFRIRFVPDSTEQSSSSSWFGDTPTGSGSGDDWTANGKTYHWQCAQGARCPSSLQFNAHVFSMEARPAGTPLTTRVYTEGCDSSQRSCSSLQIRSASNLTILPTIACDPAAGCGTSLGSVNRGWDSTSSNYRANLGDFDSPGWSPLRADFALCDVIRSLGLNCAQVPQQPLIPQDTNCPELPGGTSNSVFTCLNLGVAPTVSEISEDVLDVRASTFSSVSVGNFSAATGLHAWWVTSASCSSVGANPASGTGIALTASSPSAASASSVSAQVSASMRVGASSTTGDVLGPCVPVTPIGTSPNQDGDCCTVAEGDCDDSNPNIYPGANEVCNGVSDDCDAQIDEDFNQDGDAFTTCQSDCDDSNPNIYPGANEVCNGVNDDCDAQIDEDFDLDADRYPTDDPAASCPATLLLDCDDSDETVNPEAVELPYDYVDQDCDGAEIFDADGDGFNAASVNGIDCNDNNAAIHPGASDSSSTSTDEDCGGSSGPDPHVGLSSGSAASITAALASASSGRTVWVGRGTYLASNVVIPAGVKLRSTVGPYGGAILNAGGAAKGFVLDGRTSGGANSSSLLEGFEVIGATGTDGNELGCGVCVRSASPTIRHIYAHANTNGIDVRGNDGNSPSTAIVEQSESSSNASHGVYLNYFAGSARYLVTADNTYIGIYLENGGVPLMSHLLVRNNGSYGIQVYSAWPHLDRLTSTQNGRHGIYWKSNFVGNGGERLEVSNSVSSNNAGYNWFESAAQGGTCMSLFASTDLYSSSGTGSGNVSCGGVTTMPVGAGSIDPKLLTDINRHLATDSGVRNYGAGTDPDGSAGALGHLGGPGADGWNLDRDPYALFFWPGILTDVPAADLEAQGDTELRYEATDRALGRN